MVTLGVDPDDPVGPPPDRIARRGRDDRFVVSNAQERGSDRGRRGEGMFQAIGSGSNSYEVDTGILVVTPPVSPNG